MTVLDIKIYIEINSFFQSELVEFYYLWKKTPGANNNRPHRRRRQGSLRRIRNTRNTRAGTPKEEPGSTYSFFSLKKQNLCLLIFLLSKRYSVLNLSKIKHNFLFLKYFFTSLFLYKYQYKNIYFLQLHSIFFHILLFQALPDARWLCKI